MRAQNQSHPLAIPTTGDTKVTQVYGSKIIRDVLDGRISQGSSVTRLNLAKSASPDREAETPQETAKERRSFTRFLSQMMDQMVADFAVAAAAAHPETYILLSEINNYEEQARTYPDRRRRNRRADLQSFPRGLTHKTPGETADRPALNPTTSRRTDYLSAKVSKEGNLLLETSHESDEIEFPSLVGWLGTTLSTFMSKMRRAREVRQGIATLQSLDDRMLKDIGISRYEIQQAARGGGRERY